MINPRRYNNTQSLDSGHADDNESILLQFDEIKLNSEPVDIDDSPKIIRDTRKLFRRTREQLSRNKQIPLSMIALAFLLMGSIQINKQATYYPNNLSVLCESCQTGKGKNGGKGTWLMSSKVEGELNTSRGLLSSLMQFHLADLDTPVSDGDIPLFVHFPRSGGTTIRDILGSCFHFSLTGDFGKQYRKDPVLSLLEYERKGYSVVNVDTSTLEGIAHAKKLKLVESNVTDVIVTKDLYAAVDTLFASANRTARLFIMMRHPIERLVSLFYYLGIAHWDTAYDPDVSYISIEMFARSHRKDNNNYMVRVLSNSFGEDLNDVHLQRAKLVLQKKCLIGLLSEKEESFSRFQQYFKWKNEYNNDEEEQRICQEKLLTWGWSNKHSHPMIEEASPAWELLLKKNELDMQLYEYAKFLFKRQADLVQHMDLESKMFQQQQQLSNIDFRQELPRSPSVETIKEIKADNGQPSIIEVMEEINKEESEMKALQQEETNLKELQEQIKKEEEVNMQSLAQ